MDRDPGEFEPKDGDASSRDDEDARLDAYIASLPPAPGIPVTEGELEAALAEARADIAAGRVVPHSNVAEWLKTWGKPDFKPMPDEWLK